VGNDGTYGVPFGTRAPSIHAHTVMRPDEWTAVSTMLALDAPAPLLRAPAAPMPIGGDAQDRDGGACADGHALVVYCSTPCQLQRRVVERVLRSATGTQVVAARTTREAFAAGFPPQMRVELRYARS